MMNRPTVAILLIVLLFPKACTLDEQGKDSRTVFRYNESKGISSLDPADARNQTIIWPVSQLFNGLVELDDELRIKPSIARYWEISEDGLSYTFYLRDDVHFHASPYLTSQERKVKADDFVYSFYRLLDPVTASPGSWVFDYVSDVRPFEALNDSVLKVSLKRPFPPFLSILAMPYCYVVPREVVEAVDADFANHPVGTGPFRFSFWSYDEKLVLLKNERYFEKDSLGSAYPYLDAVSISFIKDKQSEFLEFLKGNLDFLSGVHVAYKDELLTRSGSLNPRYEDRFKLLSRPYLNTEYLGILQDSSAAAESSLLDKNLRMAINYGFDKNKMMKYLRNNLGYAATAGMIPPGLPGHLERDSGFIYDPELARKYLEKSGYGPGNPVPPINLTTTSDYLDLCEFIQFELGKLGIPIEISVSTGGSFRNMVANANLPFFRASWIADYADAENYLALFYSKNFTPEGPNYTRFKSDRFDSLYEEAIREEDEGKREILYRDMDRILIENAPVVPLFYDMVVRFVPLQIEGFEPNPMNSLVLKTVRKAQLESN